LILCSQMMSLASLSYPFAGENQVVERRHEPAPGVPAASG
jgi:hypothetical protein